MKKILLFGFIILSITFLLINCQKTVTETVTKNYIENAKTWFENNPQLNNFTLLDYSQKLNWDIAFYHEKGGEVAVEIPVKLKKDVKMTTKQAFIKHALYRLVILMDKNQYHSFLVIISSDGIDSISGMINYFNLPRNFTGSILQMKDHKLQEYKAYQNGQTNHFKNAPVICTRIVVVYSDGSYAPATPWTCSGGGGDGGTYGHTGGGSGSSTDSGGTGKPCPGDPVKNPEIAAQQGKSGLQGGTFGCTRYNPHTICGGAKGRKNHNGIDIKNVYGNPVYAMYDGTAIPREDTDTDGNLIGAGHYVQINSVINGKNVSILYFHMQKSGRSSGQVKAGDIIGYQGTSGNLASAIAKGNTVSHCHIKVKEGGIAVDPTTYFATQFGADGTGISGPCNN